MATAVAAMVATRAASAAVSVPADDGPRPGDPALSVGSGSVSAAMDCRGPTDGGGRSPVLLVHGTSTTGAQSFGWNYLPELAARGYRVCTLDLPDAGLGDIQVAAESVVVAIHRLARESGRKVDVLTHSQGALETRWALRWWPSVQVEVDDLVYLAGPNQGTTVARGLPTGCPACTQMTPGSAFLAALNGGDQTPGETSSTSLYSTRGDDLIMPNATAARVAGASNIELQTLCPGRLVTHASIVVDAVAFALVIDAFSHTGPAAPSRFDRATCLQTTFVGLPGTLGGLDALLRPVALPPSGDGLGTAEPPLKPYARPAAVSPAATVPFPITGRVAPRPVPSTATPVTVSTPRTASSGPPGRATSETFRAAPTPPITPEPLAHLSARTVRATRSTGEWLAALVAALALAFVAGSAEWVVLRRRPQARVQRQEERRIHA